MQEKTLKELKFELKNKAFESEKIFFIVIGS